MRILLADDHNLFRESLSYYLRKTLNAALEAVAVPEMFDIVILDFAMPGMNGLRGLDCMRKAAPNTPVVVLSGHITREEAVGALQRGVAGVISKEMQSSALINALHLILAGEIYVSASLIDCSATSPDGLRELEKAQRKELGHLTRREHEVIQLLSSGLSNREIAQKMEITEVTVRLHVLNAVKKMGARHRFDALRMAVEKGMGRLPDLKTPY
jgi:DNA-binding NarL/FixJ family response regulator